MAGLLLRLAFKKAGPPFLHGSLKWVGYVLGPVIGDVAKYVKLLIVGDASFAPYTLPRPSPSWRLGNIAHGSDESCRSTLRVASKLKETWPDSKGPDRPSSYVVLPQASGSEPRVHGTPGGDAW